jgi:hypothetical protein
MAVVNARLERGHLLMEPGLIGSTRFSDGSNIHNRVGQTGKLFVQSADELIQP